MRPHKANAIRQRVIVCGYHSTFAGCKSFGGIKTECRHGAQRPNVLPSKLGGDRVRSVFDDCQTSRCRKVEYGIHAARVAAKVNRHNDLGLRRDFSFGIFRAQIEMDWIDIHQHRLCFEVRHDFSRRGKGQSGNQHFVAFAEAGRIEGKM